MEFSGSFRFSCISSMHTAGRLITNPIPSRPESDGRSIQLWVENQSDCGKEWWLLPNKFVSPPKISFITTCLALISAPYLILPTMLFFFCKWTMPLELSFPPLSSNSVVRRFFFSCHIPMMLIVILISAFHSSGSSYPLPTSAKFCIGYWATRTASYLHQSSTFTCSSICNPLGFHMRATHSTCSLVAILSPKTSETVL